MAFALRELVFLRISTFGLWALLAASAVYWGLQVGTPRPTSVEAATTPSALPPVDSRAVARLLGGGAVDAPASANAVVASRFVLTGVVDAGRRHGVALIGIDGKPAKAYRVGATVDGGLILQGVEARRAHLAADGQSAVALTLELPAPRRSDPPSPSTPPAAVPPAVPNTSQGRFDSGGIRPEAGAIATPMPPGSPAPQRP